MHKCCLSIYVSLRLLILVARIESSGSRSHGTDEPNARSMHAEVWHSRDVPIFRLGPC